MCKSLVSTWYSFPRNGCKLNWNWNGVRFHCFSSHFLKCVLNLVTLSLLMTAGFTQESLGLCQKLFGSPLCNIIQINVHMLVNPSKEFQNSEEKRISFLEAIQVFFFMGLVLPCHGWTICINILQRTWEENGRCGFWLPPPPSVSETSPDEVQVVLKLSFSQGV